MCRASIIACIVGILCAVGILLPGFQATVAAAPGAPYSVAGPVYLNTEVTGSNPFTTGKTYAAGEPIDPHFDHGYTWDYATQTLTLDGFVLTAGYTGNGAALEIAGTVTDGITIVTAPDSQNSIVRATQAVKTSENYGMTCPFDLTFDGDGVLLIQGGDVPSGVNSYGLYFTGDQLVFAAGDVSCVAGSVVGDSDVSHLLARSAGIYALTGSVEIRDGSVEASAAVTSDASPISAGLFVQSGTAHITQTGGSLRARGDAIIDRAPALSNPGSGSFGVRVSGGYDLIGGRVEAIAQTSALGSASSPTVDESISLFYYYWTSTVASDPAGPGTLVPNGTPYTYSATNKYVRIHAGIWGMEFALDTITRDWGLDAGGELVSITGTFPAVPVVYSIAFDGVPTPGTLTFLDEHTLKCYTPAHAAGTVDVELLVEGSEMATLTAAYRYQVGHTITYDDSVCATCHSGNVAHEHAGTDKGGCLTCHTKTFNTGDPTEIVNWSDGAGTAALPQTAGNSTCGTTDAACHSASSAQEWHGVDAAQLSNTHGYSADNNDPASCTDTTGSGCHAAGSGDSPFFFGALDFAAAHRDYAVAITGARISDTAAPIRIGNGCAVCHSADAANTARLNTVGLTIQDATHPVTCTTCHDGSATYLGGTADCAQTNPGLQTAFSTLGARTAGEGDVAAPVESLPVTGTGSDTVTEIIDQVSGDTRAGLGDSVQATDTLQAQVLAPQDRAVTLDPWLATDAVTENPLQP
jgi:hypothetical protein